MKALIPSVLLLLSSPLAFGIETDISGNLEAQSRHVWNNQQAKDELFQDWDEDQFNLMYGNLNGKAEYENFKVETNWFVRYSQSSLYNPDPHPVRGDAPYLATQLYTFPNQLVARDVFKLQSSHQGRDYKTESVLNKFYLEWSYEEHRVTVGRMYINYGLGEVFNPINPFNQPTGLTSIQQVAQGNDGGTVAFFLSDKYTVEFYLLGDKRIEGYEGQIDHTYWVHGEYQATDKLQLDYIIGQDQNRNKVGGQVAYRFEEAMVFGQAVHQGHLVTSDPSTNLWDVMMGYDQQMTNKWHVRTEGGYQKRDPYATLTTFNGRFLPAEYFLALANSYEAHPLVKVDGTFLVDLKGGFTYFILKNVYRLKDNIEAELFGYVPLAKGDTADEIPAQKIVTTDVGVALRAFF